MWALAMKVRRILSTVAKNLNSTYRFVNLNAYMKNIPVKVSIQKK